MFLKIKGSLVIGVRGIIGAFVFLDKERAPGLEIFLGPFGPSTVKTIARLFFSPLTAFKRACAPPRVELPLAMLKPIFSIV